MRMRWLVMGGFFAAATPIGLAGAAPFGPTRTVRPAISARTAGAPTTVQKGPSTMQVGTASYRTQQNPGHYTTLDRSSLPSDPAKRVAVLKQAMEDEIFSRGEFANHGGENPPFEVVAAGLKETRPSSGEQQHAIYELPASALKNGRIDATFLLPVSGHVSSSSTENYARTNQYNIVVNGRALNKVAAGGAYVKEHAEPIALNAGMNKLELWPDGSGGVYGYPAGRIIEIHVK